MTILTRTGHRRQHFVNMIWWWWYLIFFFWSFPGWIRSDILDSDVQTLYTTESFHTPIWLNRVPNSNISNLEIIPSLSGHADLPGWMRYFRRNIGESVAYLYGTPPAKDDGDIEIDLIVLDRFNFNTTKHRIKYRILNREKIYQREVEMKFCELDLQDFFERNVSDIIKEIFMEKLWKSTKNENSNNVYLTKIARPIDVGGRFPLDPNRKECVIVRIGNEEYFTEELLRLSDEVKKIQNRDPCPERYKAATVEYIFREKKLSVDWCGFKLLENSSSN